MTDLIADASYYPFFPQSYVEAYNNDVEYYYKMNNGGDTLYNAPITVTSLGTYNYEFYCKLNDKTSAVTSLTVHVIPTAPGTANISERTDTSFSFTETTDVEYTIDNWVTSTTDGGFTNLTGNTEYTLKSRVAASGGVQHGFETVQTVRTKVSIETPTIDGGYNGETATVDKPYADRGDTVTYELTSRDGTTPKNIRIKNIDFELTGSGKVRTYTYTVPSDYTERRVTAIAYFTTKTVASLADPSDVAMYANADENADENALKSYLCSNIKAAATFDNGTTEDIDAIWVLSGTYDRKGGNYTYTYAKDNKTATLAVTITPVNAAITGAGDKMIPVNENGYSGHTDLELPTTVDVEYTASNLQSFNELLFVLWDAIPANFGKSTDTHTFTGTVMLPDWATGSDTTTSTVSVTNKIPVEVNGVTVDTKVYDGNVSAFISGLPYINVTSRLFCQGVLHKKQGISIYISSKDVVKISMR